MGIDRSDTEQGAPDKGFGRTGEGGTGGESHGEDVGFTIADPEDQDDVAIGVEPAGQGDDEDVGERPPSPPGGAGSGSGSDPGTA